MVEVMYREVNEGAVHTRVGLQGRADHGHHGGLAVPSNAVLQNPGQFAVPAQLQATCQQQCL